VRTDLLHDHDENDAMEQDMADGMDDEADANDNEITEEDSWKVISAYFAERGLCRQQLDSFDCCLGAYLTTCSLQNRESMGNQISSFSRRNQLSRMHGVAISDVD
jgi:DNA-directed RNA polymerase beta subunit